MKKSFCKLLEVDIDCIRFLWRWKLATTAALKHAIYKRKTNYRTYMRLRELEKRGYLKSLISLDGQSYVWLLDEKGFLIACDYLPALKEKGYKSENRDHDFWVSAIHLGEWLSDIPRGCDVFSEQELRRLSFAEYPDWVPKTSTHRPDGWWRISDSLTSSNNLVALEVELSKKSPMFYKDLGHYYSKTVQPYQVIWAVETERDVAYIHSHMMSGSASGAREQSFIILSQYISHQWQCPISFGKNKGKTLNEVLNKSAENGTKSVSGRFLLDARKSPKNSITKDLIQKSKVGLSRSS